MYDYSPLCMTLCSRLFIFIFSKSLPQNPKTPYVSREIEDSVMNISIEATIKSITSLTFKVKPQSYSLRYFGRYI
jgi:hypothetical protein